MIPICIVFASYFIIYRFSILSHFCYTDSPEALNVVSILSHFCYTDSPETLNVFSLLSHFCYTICFLEHLYYNGWISSNSFSSVDKQFLVDRGLAGQLEVQNPLYVYTFSLKYISLFLTVSLSVYKSCYF
jgi:hypothetical protein